MHDDIYNNDTECAITERLVGKKRVENRTVTVLSIARTSVISLLFGIISPVGSRASAGKRRKKSLASSHENNEPRLWVSRKTCLVSAHPSALPPFFLPFSHARFRFYTRNLIGDGNDRALPRHRICCSPSLVTYLSCEYAPWSQPIAHRAVASTVDCRRNLGRSRS